MKTVLFNTGFLLMLILPAMVSGQMVTLSGYITNQTTESYLKNVNIFESGSVIGTLSDSQGYYKITIPSGKINLSFTLDGFQDFSKHFTLTNDSVFSIQLKPEINSKDSAKEKEANHELSALKNSKGNSLSKSTEF